MAGTDRLTAESLSGAAANGAADHNGGGSAPVQQLGSTAQRDLFERLGRAPHEFDFFQALRLIECAAPARPRIGSSHHSEDDAVRFAQEPSLCFAPSTIRGLQHDSEGAAPRLLISFLGLLGPNGPMPLHLTEYARDRAHNHRDRTLARFLDIFHHRMISLFYRAWASHQQTVSRDRPDNDRFAGYVASLIGQGGGSLLGRDSIQDDAKSFYAGRLANQARSAEGLEAIIADYFGVPARIEQFIGRWMDLPRDYQCRLGQSRESGTLGRTTFAGSRIWDCSQKFRIVLGPLGLEDYQRFLPEHGASSLRRMRDWVRRYVGVQLDWELQLILKRADAPPTRLGVDGKLGWTTWLMSGNLARDADRLVLTERLLQDSNNERSTESPRSRHAPALHRSRQPAVT